MKGEPVSTQSSSKDADNGYAQQAELIAHALRGDMGAFGELMKSAETMTYQAVYNMVGNPQDAEDILQETALKAYRALPRFEGRSNFSTWFYRIGINTALEKLRKKSPKIAHSLDDPKFAEVQHLEVAVEDWSQNPEITSLSKELMETMDAAIAELPEEYRVILVLKDKEGLPNKEIAEQVGESIAAVKSRLHRARLFVRKKLENYLMGAKSK